MRVGLIGAGNMASALARGWGEPVYCTDAVPGKAQALVDELGGEVSNSNAVLAAAVDALFLCHKPNQLEAVAAQVEGNEKETVVVSILAGVPLDDLRRAYPRARAVVRLMPNVAVELG